MHKIREWKYPMADPLQLLCLFVADAIPLSVVSIPWFEIAYATGLSKKHDMDERRRNKRDHLLFIVNFFSTNLLNDYVPSLSKQILRVVELSDACIGANYMEHPTMITLQETLGKEVAFVDTTPWFHRCCPKLQVLVVTNCIVVLGKHVGLVTQLT